MAKIRSKRVFWILLVLLLAAIVLFAVHIQIPCKPRVMAYLEKSFGEIIDDVGLKTEGISLDLSGELCIRNLRLGKPEVISIPEASVKISLWKLLRGRMLLRSITGDSIKVKWDRGLQFMHAFQYLNTPEFQEKAMETLHKAQLKLNYFSLTDTSGEKTFGGRKFYLQINSPNSGEIGGEINISQLSFPDYPDMNDVDISLEYQTDKFTVREFKAKWIKGSLKGRLTLPFNQQEHIRGYFGFRRINLGILSQKAPSEEPLFESRASGDLLFKGLLGEKYSYDVDGKIQLKKVRLKDFPFQKDMVIQEYMSELSDMHFDRMDITKIRIRKS